MADMLTCLRGSATNAESGLLATHEEMMACNCINAARFWR